MDLSSLTYAPGSTKDRKRVGRGGSRGKQSGKGHKGQKSRSGAKLRPWFEGGQMPIQRRLPKRGFLNFARTEYQVVNIGDLAKLADGMEVTPEVLYDTGLIRKPNQPVKILGDGELKKKLIVTAHRFSETAKAKIEKAGGRATTL
ncbi:MAG TPA: 50S ribosomal protein L15 [bacterium]|jgi:large subunit ribosomal protein L15|nr:50S ribosomal protein L15 [bacterium]HNT65355.1 50S ribosomal protein L15 [bacterium]HOX86523.1 50S ribosomal protein L15 [bacterium]HPG46549.1 50S ribosomal protein L15 [bacterium]HPM98395.1 50S ribosomal protein L15 [bacterium]